MEEVLLPGEKDRKILLAELEKYGVILPLTERDTMDISVLRKLVDSLKDSPLRYSANKDPVDAFEWYRAMADYIGKLTIASVLFFCINPWAALWWPHFYFYRQRTRPRI